MSLLCAPPVVKIVEVTVRTPRVREFMEIMAENAAKSLDLEDGCLRFDVLQITQGGSSTNGTGFIFYEMYRDEKAAVYHKKQDHYKRWARFKADGGTFAEEQKVITAEAVVTDVTE